MTMNQPSELTVNQITKQYKGTKALTDVQLTFEENKIYALLGRNGAGKSTLLNIITNRIFPTTGEVRLDNQKLAENEQLLNQIFLTSEDDLYPSSMTVKKVFSITEAFYGGFDYRCAQRLVALFELDETKKIRQLSTGYRSIMKLIVALSVPVKYVFLDEPVLGLDANHRELFYQELINSYSDNPRTFVISTHLIEEIAHIIEEVIILDHGKVIENTDTESLLQKGKTITGPIEEVAAFTRNMNVMGLDRLGGLGSAYVIGEIDTGSMPANLSVSPIDLQKYFIKVTEKNNKQGASSAP